MKVTFKVPGSDIVLEADVPDTTTAFSAVAKWSELFGPMTCENCQCAETRFMHRSPSGYDFYSRECVKCGWEFKFGQTKEDHRLFPKGWEPPHDGKGGNYRDGQTYTDKPAAAPRASGGGQIDASTIPF